MERSMAAAWGDQGMPAPLLTPLHLHGHELRLGQAGRRAAAARCAAAPAAGWRGRPAGPGCRAWQEGAAGKHEGRRTAQALHAYALPPLTAAAAAPAAAARCRWPPPAARACPEAPHAPAPTAALSTARRIGECCCATLAGAAQLHGLQCFGRPAAHPPPTPPPGCSEVRKLPRAAVRRQLAQKEAAQQRGRGGGQEVSRWVSVSTCGMCQHVVKRLVQRPPGQQPQAQQQRKQALTPQKPPAQQQQQQQQQQQVRQAAPQPAQPQQAAEPAPEPAGELPAGSQAEAQQPAASQVAVIQEQQQQQRQEQSAEQPAEQQEQAEPMSWAAVQEEWGLAHKQAAAEMAAEQGGAQPAAGEQAAAAEFEGEEEEQQQEAAAAEEAAEGGQQAAPRKKRRLSWSDQAGAQLQNVRLIDRAPRPQLRKIYSWHRLARSWKAAKFSVPRGAHMS